MPKNNPVVDMTVNTHTALHEPLPDVATARLVLRYLAGISDEHGCFPSKQNAALANWLIERELGPLAQAKFRQTVPRLAKLLRVDTFTATAQMGIHFSNLAQIKKAFVQENIPLVLLKGAALGQTVYDDPLWRIMSDIDLWVQGGDMPRAAEVLLALGYELREEKAERPLALQQQSKGEICFVQLGLVWGLIELQWSPFPGWWLQRTAVIDETAVWSRKEPLPDGLAYQLAPEDMIIHSAIHMAVNHQFDILTTRHLVDMALTAQKRGVDWQIVADRAQKWQVGTAVYTALHLLEQLVGLDGLDEVLEQLRPSALRQHWLRRYLSTESVVAGHEAKHTQSRYILLFLLVDRPRDMLKLIFRTLWPEPDWLDARYGVKVSHWRHLWNVVRYGRI